MAISDRTRKLLWGRSGNLCAICKVDLVIDSSSKDKESIIGEECHIISSMSSGPRFRANFDYSQIDSYGNLIILCSNHHKMIDDQVEVFSESKLLEIKKKHESWVKDSFENGALKPIRLRSVIGEKVEYLFRIVSGKQLLNLLTGVCGSYLDHPDPEDEVEVELFAGFLQEIKDWADIIGDLDVGDRVKLSFSLSKSLSKIEEAGFWIFGNIEKKILEGGVRTPSPWHILYISIVRNNSSSIIHINLNEDADKQATHYENPGK